MSLRAYRGLLRVYPASFLGQFGEPMLQGFGDLAQRACSRGGMLSLALLWMRSIPDVAVTAIHQHFSDALKAGGLPLRTRWILACAMGASIGTVSSLTLSAMGWSAIWMNTLCVALALGFFQSRWALKRSAAGVLLWTTATALGIFIMARPFRTAMGFSPTSRVWWVEITGTILSGLGIGILQFLTLRKGALQSWRWIPAVTIANFAAVVGSLLFGLVLYPVLSLAPLGLSINLAVLAMSLAFGVIFGCVTSVPVVSMLSPSGERKL